MYRRDTLSDDSEEEIIESKRFEDLNELGTIGYLKLNYDYYIDKVSKLNFKFNDLGLQ